MPKGKSTLFPYTVTQLSAAGLGVETSYPYEYTAVDGEGNLHRFGTRQEQLRFLQKLADPEAKAA